MGSKLRDSCPHACGWPVITTIVSQRAGPELEAMETSLWSRLGPITSIIFSTDFTQGRVKEEINLYISKQTWWLEASIAYIAYIGEIQFRIKYLLEFFKIL